MSNLEGLIVLVGRILFAAFFAYAAMAHIRGSQGMAGYAKAMRFPVPAIAGWPTGIWMLVGALLLALGIWPDLGALMIAVFLLVAVAYFHRFWEADESQKMLQQTQFWRNVVGIGACLVMFGTFATLEGALRYTITEPLFTL